jgi:signal transduction histidine kinase
MKLLNYTTSYFAAILLVVITIWAGIFYYTMLDEIYDSIDDGLDNQRHLIIKKVLADTALLRKAEFGETGYKISPIPKDIAYNITDTYSDSMMYMVNENDHEPVRLLRTVFQSGGNYYQLQVVTSMVEEDDLVNALIYALIWLYLGIVLPVVLLNNFLLKKVWKPFYRLIIQLKDFRVDRMSKIRTQRTSIEEFRLLNEALQKMQDNNLQVYNSQKHFIENAAHELQTPLAIAINKLEHLAEAGELSDEQLALLSASMDNLDRLTRLNRSLLLLSKIENQQFADATAVDIRQITARVIEDFNDQVTYRQLRVTTNVQECIVQMNYDLAVIMITNLIKNAVVHTPVKGSIHIVLNDCNFSVENTGQQPLNKSTVFERFNTQQQSTYSTGLGLSIVKAIAHLYGFAVDYKYTSKHIFTVAFR